MDIDDQLGALKLIHQPSVLARKSCDVLRFDSVRIDLGATLVWRQGCQVAGLTLTPPGVQTGRVNTFAAQQRAQLAGARAIGLDQDAALFSRGEPAPGGPWHDLYVGCGCRGRSVGRSSRPAMKSV